MDIRSVMTSQPKSASPDTSLQVIARLMRDEDVGEIPIVDVQDGGRLLGVVTDRDIVVRAVAADGDLSTTTAEACMTAPATAVDEEASLEECARLMASQRVRRMPVVDAKGSLCGIVAQADLQATDARSLKENVADRVSTPH